MSMWAAITEGQGAVINGLLTLLAAAVGVLLGSVLFRGRVRDIESAIARSKESVDEHFTSTEKTLAKVREMTSELEAVVGALPTQLSRLELAIEDRSEGSSEEQGDQIGRLNEAEAVNDPRLIIRQQWGRIRDYLEDRSTDLQIDGRTRAKYMRIDRRSYGDFIEALEHDGTISESTARLAREAYALRNSFKRKKANPTGDEIARMQSLADGAISGSA